MTKLVRKTYGHECGLSATFRQWRAKSHCRFIHGYALAFSFLFECADDEVDENGWVINFGGLKPLKEWLTETFDHKTLVATDDPELKTFQQLAMTLSQTEQPLIQLVEVERVGCEAFAEKAANFVLARIEGGQFGDTKARLIEVECREHAGNAAIWRAPKLVVERELKLTIDSSGMREEISELLQQVEARVLHTVRDQKARQVT